MTEKYYAASNSSDGFCSYYNEVFDPSMFSRIYAIKGGSGTGKAFFMKAVAKAAEKRGFSVRYIYCSSDASSLDGIVIKEPEIAVLDATAPHIYEPKYIGAVESLVDLSAFLDEGKLVPRRKEIEALNRQKQIGFECAYRYLRAYHTVCLCIEKLVKPAVNFDKISHFASRMLRFLEEGNGVTNNLLVRSIGMRGLCSFDTYYENASVYYEVNDYYDSAHFLISEIFENMKKKNVDVNISRNPIIPARIDALATLKEGLTFEISNGMNEDVRTINMKRFVDGKKISAVRSEYRAAARIRDEALCLAMERFEMIKGYHFELEKIYGEAMDFEAKEKYTEEFCNKIFEMN